MEREGKEKREKMRQVKVKEIDKETDGRQNRKAKLKKGNHKAKLDKRD